MLSPFFIYGPLIAKSNEWLPLIRRYLPHPWLSLILLHGVRDPFGQHQDSLLSITDQVIFSWELFFDLSKNYSFISRDYLKIWKEEFSRVSSCGLKWGNKPPRSLFSPFSEACYRPNHTVAPSFLPSFFPSFLLRSFLDSPSPASWLVD